MIREIYSYKEESLTVKDDCIRYAFDDDMTAIAVYLEKQ
jgi:hypothetical protein